jgi:hypothetical protein
MKDEMKSIDDNNTWTLTSAPPGRKIIGSKWVYKTKLDGNNDLEKYKARVVAKRYSQVAGVDFDETYAPVARIEAIRQLFAIIAFFNMYMLQADFKTAFLNGLNDMMVNLKGSSILYTPTGSSSATNPYMDLPHLVSTTSQ